MADAPAAEKEDEGNMSDTPYELLGATSAMIDPPPKRPRGRPPKPKSTSVSSLKKKTEEPKPVGRPKKAPKRPGRPPKPAKPANVEEGVSDAAVDINKELHAQIYALNSKLQVADSKVAELLMQSETREEVIRNLEEELSEAEKIRKKLHNEIMLLKGKVRVYCRVRPFIPDNRLDNGMSTITYPKSMEFKGCSLELMHKDQKCRFKFDKVFSEEASQEDVFVEVSPLIQSALDGDKICVFAYGQTASGKTYTMMGRAEPGKDRGLIPRSLEQIFKCSHELESKGWVYTIKLSILELHLKTIRDLLVPLPARARRKSRSDADKCCTIHEDRDGNYHVSNLTVVEISGLEDVLDHLNQAIGKRSVGTTSMNEESSRSHFVFTLQINGTNERSGEHTNGVLNFIDLAGSERSEQSGATGARFEEAKSINTSLADLGSVIRALVKKDDYVPYSRTSLTKLLKRYLGGDSKMLMFVNVSPLPSSSNETWYSLKFASEACECEIKRAKVIPPTPRQGTQPGGASKTVKTPKGVGCSSWASNSKRVPVGKSMNRNRKQEKG